jgi:hypothetical protein
MALTLHDDAHGRRQMRQRPIAQQVNARIIRPPDAREREAEGREGVLDQVFVVGADVEG